MTDTDQQQDYEQESWNEEDNRSTLMDRVLDFVAPQVKDAVRSKPAERKQPKRERSYFARAVPKSNNPLKLSPAVARVLGLVMLALITIDLVAFSRIATNRFFTLSGNLIYFFRLDTMTFHLSTLLEIQVILCLVLCAVLGGLFIYWLLKFTVFLSDCAGLSVQRRHVTYILGTLTVLFFVFFLISILSGNPYSSYKTFHYLAPFLTYISGLAIYSLSQLRFEV